MNVFSVLGQEDPDYHAFWGDTVGMEIADSTLLTDFSGLW